MKSSAASKEDGLYRLYADEVGNPDDEPTRVGYHADEARQAHLCDPTTQRAPHSFFPPDDPNRSVPPPAISGEYAAVRLEDLAPRSRPPESFPPLARPIESVRPVDKTFNIRFHEKAQQQRKSTSDGSFGFGWMLGLAFLSASTVFVWLWFVARWFVR